MNIERKTRDVVGKSFDDQTGIAEMIVSVFNNVDEGDDVIQPGFFKESLEKRKTSAGMPKVKGVWAHDWSMPIAKTLEAKELLPGDILLPPSLVTLGGLYIKGQFNLETQRGKEAYSDLKFGTVDEFSIGFGTKQFERDNETGIRKLIKGDLYEWSPVLVGMNDETVLLSIKSHQPLETQIKAVLEAVDSLGERVRSLKGLRKEEGRGISAERSEELKGLVGELHQAADELNESLLDRSASSQDDAKNASAVKNAAQVEFNKFINFEARQNGVGKGN